MALPHLVTLVEMASGSRPLLIILRGLIWLVPREVEMTAVVRDFTTARENSSVNIILFKVSHIPACTTFLDSKMYPEMLRRSTQIRLSSTADLEFKAWQMIPARAVGPQLDDYRANARTAAVEV